VKASPSQLAFLEDGEIIDPETGEVTKGVDLVVDELSTTVTVVRVASADPWEGYAVEHRVITPSLAATQAAIEELLGERAARESPKAAPRTEDRDERGNSRAVRRYMARLYQADREQDREAFRAVVAEAHEDRALDEDEVARIDGLADSLRRRWGR